MDRSGQRIRYHKERQNKGPSRKFLSESLNQTYVGGEISASVTKVKDDEVSEGKSRFVIFVSFYSSAHLNG